MDSKNSQNRDLTDDPHRGNLMVMQKMKKYKLNTRISKRVMITFRNDIWQTIRAKLELTDQNLAEVVKRLLIDWISSKI